MGQVEVNLTTRDWLTAIIAGLWVELEPLLPGYKRMAWNGDTLCLQQVRTGDIIWVCAAAGGVEVHGDGFDVIVITYGNPDLSQQVLAGIKRVS